MNQNEHNFPLTHIRHSFMTLTTIIFGSIGLHDFIIKKWQKGLLHIVLVLIPLAFALLKFNPLNLDSPVMPNIFFWTSYGWGIIELYFYLKKVKFQTEPEIVIDYNTFTASNKISIIIFTVMVIIEILALSYIIFIMTHSLSSPIHDGHGAVLTGLVLTIVLTVHGIIAVIAAGFFNYSRNLKNKLDHMHYDINQSDSKIFTIANFSYRKIIKPSIAINIGLFIISIILLS